MQPQGLPVPAPAMLQTCWSPAPSSPALLCHGPHKTGPYPGPTTVHTHRGVCCQAPSAALLLAELLQCRALGSPSLRRSNGTFTLLCHSGQNVNLEDKHSEMTVDDDRAMLQITEEVMTSLQTYQQLHLRDVHFLLCS